jgi:hypothetical protein
MSIAPPGYPTEQTDPGSGNRHVDDTVQYEFKSVQALRGRENGAKVKWQNQGWEFVSENRGTLRTELTFRRVKPKTLGRHLLSIVATFRRLPRKTRSVLVSGSDHWGIGASGDFLVMLKTKVGADLEVFADQSDATGWQDGTKVEMVVKVVERTINGETTDGFFEAESAKTISEGTTE